MLRTAALRTTLFNAIVIQRCAFGQIGDDATTAALGRSVCSPRMSSPCQLLNVRALLYRAYVPPEALICKGRDRYLWSCHALKGSRRLVGTCGITVSGSLGICPCRYL